MSFPFDTLKPVHTVHDHAARIAGIFALVGILLGLTIQLSLAVPVSAQGGEPGAQAKDQLTKELWCPICNGIRLDVCEQKVCEQMRELIDTEMAQGKTTEQIKADFVDLYGPVVLGEPPRQGFNLVAWIVPILLMAGGLIGVVLLTRRWVQRPQSATLSPRSAATDQPEDEYLRRVENELKDL